MKSLTLISILWPDSKQHSDNICRWPGIWGTGFWWPNTCCCPSSDSQLQPWRTVLSTLTIFCHKLGLHVSPFFCPGLSLKSEELSQPLGQGSLHGWGSYSNLPCSNPQLMGDRILWINAPAWHPPGEQFCGTCYRVSQRIPGTTDLQ